VSARRRAVRGDELVRALKTKLYGRKSGATNRNLANSLGYKESNIGVMSQNLNISPAIVANIVYRAALSGKRSASVGWIKTVVEFYDIKKVRSKQGTRWEIFDKDENKHSPLHNLLKETKAGLYAFYNSEGSIIYLGKTKNNLWSEMQGAFNRDMTAHEIWTVAHPHTPFERRSRRIRRTSVHLHDTAVFFSAYEVDSTFIDRLETLFIRVLPNNLTNVRIEGQTERSVERPQERYKRRKKKSRGRRQNRRSRRL
jgi:hypothetical protein